MYASTVPLTDSICQNPFQFNISNLRGFSWADGEFRTTMFNNYYSPNAPRYDCIGTLISPPAATRASMLFAAYGWRRAELPSRGSEYAFCRRIGSFHWRQDRFEHVASDGDTSERGAESKLVKFVPENQGITKSRQTPVGLTTFEVKDSL